MTVEQLAQELGISVKEALALCLVAGVKAQTPASRLKPADVEAIRKILAGEKKLIDPTRPGANAKVPKKRAGCGAWAIRGAVAMVALLVFAGIAVRHFGGDGSINVAAGDCFDALLVGGTVFGTSIDPKPCDEAGYRAFAVLQLDEVFQAWPGVESIESRARDRCIAIGQQLDVTGFVFYFGPGDEVAWDNPASRKIVCAESA